MVHLLSAPVTYLLNCSLAYSYTPPQWRSSCIAPVSKNLGPQNETDFRPISEKLLLPNQTFTGAPEEPHCRRLTYLSTARERSRAVVNSECLKRFPIS